MKMLTCKEASRLLSEGQERPLSVSERWSLRLHLWMCDNCRRFDRQMDFLRSALQLQAKNVEADSQGPDLSSAAREKILEAIRQKEKS